MGGRVCRNASVGVRVFAAVVVVAVAGAVVLGVAAVLRSARTAVVEGRFLASLASASPRGASGSVAWRPGPGRAPSDTAAGTQPLVGGALPGPAEAPGDLRGDLFIAGAVGVAEVADWWHVDDTVLNALSHFSGEQIESATDLWALVHERDYHLVDSWWDALRGHLDEGILASLRGHVGEQMAAGHLAASGAHVTWPGTGNQPGWDLHVDGHPVNVKVTADAGATASEHFAAHPGIPVVVNGDAADIPAGAIHFDPQHGLDPAMLVGDHVVAVDDALSASDAASAVQDAVGADAMGALTDVHIPLLTVALTAARSTSREGRLLREGKTTRSRATKNVAVDTTSRAAGVVAGAKTGAAAGFAVDAATAGATFGAGAILGGIAGAFLGAQGGSALARRHRLKPLRAAQDRMRETLQEYEAGVGAALQRRQRTYREAETRARLSIALRAAVAREELATIEQQERAVLRQARRVDAQVVLEDVVTLTPDRIRTRTPRLARWAPMRLVWWLHRRAHAAWRRELERACADTNQGPDGLARFWDTVAATPWGETRMRSWVHQVEAARRRSYLRCATSAASLASDLAAHRDTCRGRVLDVVSTEVSEGRAALQPLADQLTAAYAEVEREMDAAGVRPAPRAADGVDETAVPAM